MRKMKGRNPAPWINGAILTAIRRKESARQKLKSSPNNYLLQQKFKTLRCEVKRMLRESREKFFTSLATDVNQSPKRLWSVLKKKNIKVKKHP
jgi:hypothetical protein